MLHPSRPLTSPDVIEPSEYSDMQSLLEAKVRDIARLQRQVEDLKNSLETILPPSPSLQGSSPELAQGGALHRNHPRRITVSLNDHVHELLIERSMAEGRSVSNLAAFILETHLQHPPQSH